MITRNRFDLFQTNKNFVFEARVEEPCRGERHNMGLGGGEQLD